MRQPIVTGQQFGRLTAVKPAGKTPSGHSLWELSCSCGNSKLARADHLQTGRVVSCGCFRVERVRQSARGRTGVKPGDKLHRLTLIGPSPSGWLWRCDCGNTVTATPGKVRSGHTQSCGCLSAELSRERRLIHGHTAGRKNSRTYNCWHSMRARCLDPDSAAFPYYGGRGIKICARWLESFANFLADMGESPGPEFTIDRKDTNGDYSPENCRWVGRDVQSDNRRHVSRITFNGKTQSIAKWSRELDIPYHTLRARIRAGWEIKDALTEPVQRSAGGQGHER